MKIYASFVLALYLTGSIAIQAPPDTLWTKIFGGDNQNGCGNNPGDIGRTVEITDDHGYIISGWTNSFGPEDTDVWLIGTDTEGNEIWSHALTVNDDADDAVYDMKQTRDGGYILTGITDIVYCGSGHGGEEPCGGKILLIRINELGDTLWTQKYAAGDRGWSEGWSVAQSGDGGFVVVGRADTEENGWDVWVSLTDDKGTILWTKTFASDGYDEGRSVQQTDDGGFVIVGLTQPQNEETQKAWLIRTNELGDTLWTQKYLVGDWSEGRSVLQTDDGGFLIAGMAESWEENLAGESLMPSSFEKYLERVFSEKQLSYAKNVSDKININSLYSELEKELMTTEKTNSSKEHLKLLITQQKIIEGRDAILIRTNELGEILWTEIYGGPGWDDINSVFPTRDGGFILAGAKDVQQHDSQDIWLIRTNEVGDTIWTVTLGDSAREIAYDAKQTPDNGYIVTGLKYNRELDVDQTWLIRLSGEATELDAPPEKTPDKFVLEQNYPNPFNPNTMIIYQLPVTSYVDLSIYNLLGQKVITLISERQAAGRYQVEWNGTDQTDRQVSSGIYIYKLVADNKSEMRKMMLIK